MTDEKKHSLVLNLQVLKGLKRKAKGSLVSREYVPVELTAVRNPGGEAGVVDPNARQQGHKIKAKVVWPVPSA